MLVSLYQVSAQDVRNKKELPSTVNSYSRVVCPVISPDGSKLFFSRKYHPANVGLTKDPDDIWCSEKVDGYWSEPKNVSLLNTKGSNVLCGFSLNGAHALVHTTINNDVTRSVFQIIDAETFRAIQTVEIVGLPSFLSNYYASITNDEQHIFLSLPHNTSASNMDLYVCHKKGAGYVYTEPESLGATLNTQGLEGSPFLAADNSTFYFSSSEHNSFGNQDIFVSKRLDDSWKNWSEPKNLGVQVNSEFIEHCFTIAGDGETAYLISVNENEQIGIFSAQVPVESRPTKTDSLRDSTDSKRRNNEMLFYFEHNQDMIPNISISKSLVESSTVYPLEIIGYTDCVGDSLYNKKLSLKRAIFIKKLLVAKGAKETNIKIIGAGTDKRCNESNRNGKEFRRAEIHVVWD